MSDLGREDSSRAFGRVGGGAGKRGGWRGKEKYTHSLAAIAIGIGIVGGAVVASPSDASVRRGGAETGNPRKLVSVTVAITPAISSLQFPVAVQAGIFAKNGLKVKVIPITNIGILPAAVASGQYNFAQTVAPIFLNARQQNLPLVVTGGGQLESNAFGLSLVVPPSSNITSAQDLEGKTVGTPFITGNFTLCLQYWIYTHGGHYQSVHLQQVPFTSMQAQADAGLIDAGLQTLPYTNVMLQAGYRKLVDPCRAVDSPAAPQMTTFLISSDAWARGHKSVIRAMQTSINDANVYIHAHPAVARQALAKLTGVSLSDVGQTFPKYVGREKPADIYSWEKVMLTLGALKQPLDLTNAFVN